MPGFSRTLRRFAPLCLGLGFGLTAALWVYLGEAGNERRDPPEPAPEFVGIEAWLNSRPLSMASLRGRVVLVEFWTYRCINCLRVLPHVVEWEREYRAQGLVVIGVHTPETEQEQSADEVRSAMHRLGITFPVALDNGYRTWDSYGNFAWPATYLIDRKGRIVRRHYGEGEYAQTEAAIAAALADDGP